MAKTDIWFPLYCGDYLRSTGRLNTQEHGAYLLLIIDYWCNGHLPDDDSVLARITKLSAPKWRECRKSLEGYFTVSAGSWKHDRIDREIAAAKKRSMAARKNGAKGGRPKNVK